MCIADILSQVYIVELIPSSHSTDYNFFPITLGRQAVQNKFKKVTQLCKHVRLSENKLSNLRKATLIENLAIAFKGTKVIVPKSMHSLMLKSMHLS